MFKPTPAGRRRSSALLGFFIVASALVVSPRLLVASLATPPVTIPADSWQNGTPGTAVTLESFYNHNFTLNGTARRVKVVYTTTATGAAATHNIPTTSADGDSIPDWAQQVGRWAERAWRDYDGFGFSFAGFYTDTDGVTTINATLFDMNPGLAGWCCWGGAGYVIDAPTLTPGNEIFANSVVLHEHWHATAWSDGRYPGWVSEGSAAFMEDSTVAALDVSTAGGWWRWPIAFLGMPEQNLTAKNYPAGLFWKYVTERMGTVTTEPQYGTDFLTAVNTGHDPANMLGSIDNAARARSGGSQTVETLFRDFCIANYAKWFTATEPSLPPAYKYVDEAQMPGAYDFDGRPATPPVRCIVDLPITAASPPIAEITFNQPWSARYHRFRPDATVPLVSLNFRQDSREPVTYALFKVKSGRVTIEVAPGPDFVRSVLNDAYDEIVVAVITYRTGANYRYTVNGRGPLVSIIDPIQGRPAMAGNSAAPRSIVVRASVLDTALGGEPIRGIPPEQFSVTINGTAAPTAVPPVYVAGSYWFLVNPPPLPAGLYPLRVAWSTVSDTENNAVQYDATPLTPQNTVLVIDRSGSMADFSKIDAAKNAARLYTDSWQTGDSLGVVSFADDASEPADLTLRPFNSTSREDARMAINGLMAIGGTSIGDGLIKGMDELIARAANSSWHIILLSDGQPTSPRPVSDFTAAYNTRRNAMPAQTVPRVHTIALGPDADRTLMQQIATDTGGQFLYLSEPPAGGRAALESVITISQDLPNDLAEVYRVMAEGVTADSQIYSARRKFIGDQAFSEIIQVEPGAEAAVIVLNWSGNVAPGPIGLFKPSGSEYPVSWSDTTHRVYRIAGPEPGPWKLVFDGCEKQACTADYLIEAAVQSSLRLFFEVPTPPGERAPGAPVTLLAILADGGPVKGATVEAEVTLPEIGEAREQFTIQLYDDGLHNDGNAGDGIYGNDFYQTRRGGAYDVRVRAEGTRPVFGPYVRLGRGAFVIEDKKDRDQDGMPDEWEIAHGLNPNVNDAKDDLDNDGVTNLEEFLQGLLPEFSDSDGGGENDASEIANGTDPHNPADDAARPVVSFICPHVDSHYYEDPQKNPYINRAFFRVEAPAGADRLMVYRRDSGGGAWSIIEQALSPKTGLYLDPTASPGKTYDYKVAAAFGKHISALSQALTCTAKADPVAPEGIVRINGGAATVSKPDVILDFGYSPDTVEMRVANTSGALDEAKWVPAAPQMAWTLDPLVPVGGMATVFAEFRDAAGNEGEVDPASVLISGSGASDYDTWIAGYVAKSDPQYQQKADPGADLDGDGWVNWLEYATASNPLKPDRESPFVTLDKNGSVQLCYRRRSGASLLVTDELQCSGDLAQWEACSTGWKVVSEGTTSLGGDAEQVCMRLTPLNGAPAKLFLRIRFKQN